MPSSRPDLAQDFLQKLKTVQGIVWDLDNTLYRIEDAVKHAFHIAIARAALEAGVPLELDEAVKAAEKSYAEYGYSGRIFVRDHGVDDVWLHHRFHDHLDETMIDKNAETAEFFRQTELRHALITHSSGPWARKVLSHLGLREWFADDHILALEDYAFQKKAESAAPFMLALERLQLDAGQTLFVEDTPRNLSIPHRLGMGTVLVHYGQPPRDMPAFIDADYNNALDLLRHIVQQKNGRQIL